MAFNVHYLIPDPEGEIKSGIGGTTIKIGRNVRVRAACNPKLQLSKTHRGTHETWLVECKKCKETEEFKRDYRPRPSAVQDELDPNLGEETLSPDLGPNQNRPAAPDPPVVNQKGEPKPANEPESADAGTGRPA